MNILVTLDRNYLPPLRVMLGSLLRNDPGETFEIYQMKMDHLCLRVLFCNF